jgi:membrane protease YdiL (CAAX protease family)
MEKTSSLPNRSLLSFFVITFAFSWFFWLFGVLASLNLFSLPFPNMGVVVIGAHGPLVAALVLTYHSGGWKAVKKLLAAGFNLRLKLIWWLVILLLPVAVTGLAVWIAAALNGYQPDLAMLSQPWMILPTFLFMFFLGGSFQEEFGWRGFALPRLLERWNPLIASLILGGFWGVWHLPLFYITGTGQTFMPFGFFLLLAVAFSVLFTWIYLRTKRNLFSALLLHTAINTSLSIFPPIEQRIGGSQVAFIYMTGLFLLAAIIVVILDRFHFFRQAESH